MSQRPPHSLFCLSPIRPHEPTDDKITAALVAPRYLTTEEAAAYLRRSVSWLLRQKRIPYYPGKPNRYRREDIDRWMEENVRHEPML